MMDEGVTYYWDERVNKHYAVHFVAWGRDNDTDDERWYWILWNEDLGGIGPESYSTSRAMAKREAESYAKSICLEAWECDEFGVKAA